jgi:DNA-binding PadR family transcriptional regulator
VLQYGLENMTNAELAILSLVAEQPRHGYEIEQVIEERGMREWTEVGFSSIYYLLKKLERDALIEGSLEEAQRGPARKVYHLTPAGSEALQRGVLDALSTPQRGYPSVLLGLSSLPAVPVPHAVEALQKYHATLVERQAQLQERWSSQQPLPYFVDALFTYSLALLETEIRWVDDFITRLEEEHGQD